MKPLPLIALLLLSAPAAADVYFIQAGPAIKIGVSSDPARRLRTFQTANPVKLELLGTTEGGRDLEQRFHDCLESERIRGEWFRASEKTLRNIGKWLEGWRGC